MYFFDYATIEETSAGWLANGTAFKETSLTEEKLIEIVRVINGGRNNE